MKKFTKLSAIGLITLGLIFSASPLMPNFAGASTPKMKVHMVGVDGAGFIVELPNGKKMVVDAGVGANGNGVYFFDKLDSLGITKVDYMVATHQHGDHIGNFNNIINNYQIGGVYFPGGNAPHNSQDFIWMENAANNKGISITYRREAQDIFPTTTVSGIQLATYTFSPIPNVNYNYGTDTSNTNSQSLVFKIQYGSTGILFTGDALDRTLGEYQGHADSMLRYNSGTTTRKYPLVGIQVMTAGHHGANGGSNPEEFLKSIPSLTHMLIPNKNDPQPTTSIYKFKERLKDAVYDPAIAFWTTYTNGDVLIEADGTSWNFPETPEWKP